MRYPTLVCLAVCASLLVPSTSAASPLPMLSFGALAAASIAPFDPRPRPLTAEPLRLEVVTGTGLPVGRVRAVAINVTVVNAGSDLFVTVWPSGSDRPVASSLNLAVGQTRPNLVVSPVGPDGAIMLATGSAYADVLVDLVGWFGDEGGYAPKGPTRVFDSRVMKSITPGVPFEVPVRADVGQAVVANLTGINAKVAGFLTAWPTGTAKPGTSNLNLTRGQTAANLVVLPSGGTERSITVESSMPVDVLVDVAGILPVGYLASGPTRLLDTRSGTRVVADTETVVRTGAPQGQPIAVNVTAVDPINPGFVTVWPTGTPRPETSTVNAATGATPNMALVPAGHGGSISLWSSMATHLIVDSFGSLLPESGYRPVPAVRLLDTRAPVLQGDQVPHGFPVDRGTNVAYSQTHGNYPGTDVFAACGTPILSVVDGVVSHVRRVDDYRAANPATWGGRSVAVVGDDGVRYYGSHYDTIGANIIVGRRVNVGTPLGTMGRTGDTTVCHLHFGISVPCPGPEWSVRRGVVWPWRYLDAWRSGTNLHPQAELSAWQSTTPGACWTAMSGPFAGDGG